MNLIKLFAFILIFGCSAVVNSQEQGPRAPATPSPVAQEIATGEQADEAAMAQLIRENQELLYAKDIAEIRADLLDANSNDIENLLAILGILMTVVVIFFAFRFGKAAVEEAKAAAVIAVEKEFGSLRTEVEGILEDARASVANIRTHEKTAEEITSGLPTGEAPQDTEKRKGLREIAKSALSKPRRERTADEYRALVMVDLMDEDWAAMERRVNAMSVLFEGECSDEDMGFALFNRAFALGQLNRPEDALAAFDIVIERFGASDDIRLQERVAAALFNKGVAHGKLGQSEDELAAYDTLIERFGASDDIRLQERVAQALFNKGVTLGELDQPKDALAAYDTLIERFGASDDIRLQERVAAALSNKGVAHGKLGQSEDALAAYDIVIERFGASDDIRLQEQVAQALFNKGVTLGELDQPKDALAAFDIVIERFGASDDIRLQELVAKALVYKGATLGELDQPKDALAAFDMVIERFGASDDIRLQVPVANALFNKGATLGELDQPKDALAAYDIVIERFGASDDIRLQELVAKALFNKACTYALQERVGDAIGSLDQWQQRVGHLDCDDILGDADFDKIRDRSTFRKFLKDNGCDPDAGPDSN